MQVNVIGVGSNAFCSATQSELQTRYIDLKIDGNSRNLYLDVALKPDWGKSPALPPRQAFGPSSRQSYFPRAFEGHGEFELLGTPQRDIMPEAAAERLRGL